MTSYLQTPSQTVGPYFAYGLTAADYGYDFNQIANNAVAVPGQDGQRIRLTGQVFDGHGAIIPDAVIELWQADASGQYPGPGSNSAFKGFGRQGTGHRPDNHYVFDTIKPGVAEGQQAPYITLVVYMRGLLTHAYTRVYFADEAAANAADPVLASVPADRQHTLLAAPAVIDGVLTYRFDIHMQGADETVFFDV